MSDAKVFYVNDQSNQTAAIIVLAEGQGEGLEVTYSDNFTVSSEAGDEFLKPLATVVLRDNDELKIIFDSGKELLLANYFSSCQDESCSVLIANGEDDFVDLNLASDGIEMSDKSSLLYIQGSQELLLTLVDDDITLLVVYEFIAGTNSEVPGTLLLQEDEGILAGATELVSGSNIGLIAGGILGVGAIAAAAGGLTTASTPAIITKIITASVLLGPLTDDGAGTTVALHQADGTKIDDMTYNATTGLFEYSYTGSYTGPIIAILRDTDSDVDYINEATKQGANIGDSFLVSLGSLAAGQTRLDLSINEATTAVAAKAGVRQGTSAELLDKILVSQPLTTEKIEASNTAIAKALGLEGVDLATASAVAVIDKAGAANTNANAYGVALAKLSEVRQDNSQTITQLAQQLANSVDDSGQANNSLTADLAEASNAIANDNAYVNVTVVQTQTNESLTVIGTAASNKDASNLTLDDLSGITGVTGVASGNLAAYQAAIAATTTFSNPPTAADVQAVIKTVNDAAPTVTIASNVITLKAGETATIIFTLSKASNNFAATDVTVAGGTLSAFAQDSTNSLVYTATFTPTANSTTNGSVSVAADTFTDTDATATDNAISTALALTVDTVAPVINTVTLSWGGTVNATDDDSDGTITVATTGVEDDQIVTISLNGNNYTGTVSSNSTTIIVAASALQALAQGSQTYTVNVSDAAGNAATENTGSFTVDTTPPTISTVTLGWGDTLNATEDDSTGTVTVATTGAEDGQTVTFNLNSVDYTGTVSSNSTTITVSETALQALAQGSQTYTVNVSDAAGNTATENTGSFTVDTTAPTAPTVTALTTSDTTPTITGTAALGTGEVLTVVVNGATYSDVTVTSGAWSIDTETATPDTGTTLGTFTDGTSYSVTATVTDTAGNITADTTNNEITIDTTAPTVTIAYQDGSGNAVTSLSSGQTATVVFTLSEASSDFAATDITASGGALSAFEQDGTNALQYTATFTPTANSTTDGSVSVAADTFTDAAGNNNTAAPAVTISVDTTAPTTTVTIDSISTDSGSSSSDFITNDNNGLTINATLSAALITGEVLQYSTDGSTWKAVAASDITGTTVSLEDTSLTSTATLQMRVVDAADSAGAVASQVITIDTTAPTVAIAYQDGSGNALTSLSSGETATVVLTLSEASSDFAATDITASGGTLSAFAQDGTNPLLYTATFTPTANSTTNGSVSVAADTFTDAAGNNNTAATAVTISVDTVSPTVAIAYQDSSGNTITALKAGETATVVFTLSEASSDFAVTGITASGGALSAFAQDGTNTLKYTATFTPTANSTTDGSVSVAADTFTDTAGNNNTAAAAVTISVDTTAPTAPTVNTLTTDDTTPTITGTATLSTDETLTVIVNGATYSNVTVDGSNNWSIDTGSAIVSSGTLGSFASGSSYPVTATVTDAAGNSTADTTTDEITIITQLQVDSITSPNQIIIAGTSSANGTYTLVTDPSSLAFGNGFTPGGDATVLDTTKPVYTYNDGTNDWYVWARETSGYHISQLSSTAEWYWEGSGTGTFVSNPSLVANGAWAMSSAPAPDFSTTPSSLTLDNVPTNSEQTFTITFNDAVSTLNASSISFVDASGTAVDVTNWTIGTPTVTAGTDNKIWTVSVTPPTGANAVDTAIKLVVGSGVSSTAGSSLVNAYTQVNLQAFDTEIPTVSSVAITGAESDDTAKTSALVAGDKVVVTVTMSEATTVSGTPIFTIQINGENKTASYVSGSGSTSLVFEYTVLASDAGGAVTATADALALNDGTLADAAGNPATLTTAAQTSTGVSIDGAPAIDMQANEAGIQLSSNTLLSNAQLATGFSIASDLAASTDTDIDQINIVLGGGALDTALDKLVIGGTDIAMNADIASTSVTVSIDGNNVTYSYAYTAATKTLVLTKASGNFAAANIEDIVAGIQLKNTETTPAEGARTATITYEDVAGNTSQEGVSTLTNTAPPLVTVSMNSVITDLPVITGSASTGTVTVRLDLDGDAIYSEAIDDKSATYTVTVTDNTWSLDLSSVNPDGASAPISFADISAAQLAVQVTATDSTTGVSSVATEQASKQATSYSISSGQVIEDDTADKVLTFVITREGDLSQAGSVDYTFDADLSTVVATGDNVDVTGASTTATTLTFAAGERFKTVDVTVKGDNLKELNERVVLKLSNSTEGSISEADGIGTILESDAGDYVALFGLQDLNLAKETFAIRVRRSSDNTEMDIGFDKFGNLDTDALLRFVNNNSDGSAVSGAKGYVSIWYNQGSGNDFTQTVGARQGVIVNNGNLITASGTGVGTDLPMISFNEGLNGTDEANSDGMLMEGLETGAISHADMGFRYEVTGSSHGPAFRVDSAAGGILFKAHVPVGSNTLFAVNNGTRLIVNNQPGLNTVNDLVFSYNAGNTTAGTAANNYHDATIAMFSGGVGVGSLGVAGASDLASAGGTIALAYSPNFDGDLQAAKYGQFSAYLNNEALGRADKYVGDNLNNAFSYAGETGVTAVNGLEGFDTVLVSGDGTGLNVGTVALTSIELIDLSQDSDDQSVTLAQAQVAANGGILNVLMGSGDSVAYTPTSGTQTTLTQSATQDMVVFGTSGNDTINMSAYDEVVYGLGGSDTFYYSAWSDAGTDSSQDTIHGFDIGASGDVLNLGDLLDGETLATLSNFIQVTDAGSGGDVTLKLDIDGTGGYSDLTIVLTGIGTGSLTLDDLTTSNIIIT